MSFDIEIFQKLNEFRKNEKKSMDFLKYQAKEMFRILSEKELDAFVQFKALNQFKISLESIIKINNRHKSWWQWFISFFGFVSQDEKSIRHILRTTRKSLSPLKHLSPLNFLLQEPTLNEQLGYKFYNRKEKIKYLAHHLMGTQVFSETSQFHGMSASDAYKHFYHDLKDFIDQYYTNDESIIHDFNKVLSNLEYAYILAYQLDIFCAFRKHLRDDQKSGFQANFIFNIKMKILNLSPGESFITPYVYQEENGGHALIIEWVKDNDGQFFAKIINTGEGNDQTASFKTQFLSFFYDERPIKKTNNYPLEVLHTDFIDRMFDPIFSSEKSADKMNDFFSNIPLNDASEQLILQTNGICAHACILAWFQTIISAALYSLFNVYTLEKAQKRLVALNHAKRNEDLSQLETAAQKTVINAQTQLQQHYENKSKYLQNLNNELAKNRKKSQQIVDHPEYISKKIKKLSDFEKEQLERIKSLTDAPKASIFSIFTGNKSKDEQSPRLRKAILAKKIYEHQNFLEHTKSTLQSPQGANF